VTPDRVEPLSDGGGPMSVDLVSCCAATKDGPQKWLELPPNLESKLSSCWSYHPTSKARYQAVGVTTQPVITTQQTSKRLELPPNLESKLSILGVMTCVCSCSLVRAGALASGFVVLQLKAMMSKVTTAVSEKMQQLLRNDAGSPPLSVWNAIKQFLMDNGFAYSAEISPESVLCHPSNRGSLGINARSAHKTGAGILKIGCDVSELEKAVVIEVARDPTVLKQQMDFNAKQFEYSENLLAPVSGKERYLSLGGGHAIAFFRAVLSNSKTCEASIADADGRLNAGNLGSRDNVFKRCTTGWRMIVLSAVCEEIWPELPSLVQRSLNASQNLGSNQTELETMMFIANFTQAAENPDWQAAAHAATGTQPLCSGYVATLAKFVRLFSGGPGAPIIAWLDNFAKTFAPHAVLGSEFLQSVCDVEFPNLKVLPIIRQALLATNLVSTKRVDGISRCLVKGDVSKLANKDMVGTLEVAEKACCDLAEFLTLQASANRIDSKAHVSIYGKFLVRLALHMTGKSKSGFDNREFDNLDALKKFTAKELQESHSLACASLLGWSGDEEVDPGSVKPSSASAAACTFKDLNSAEWLAANSGFVAGSVVYERAVGLSTVFRIQKVDHVVELVELNLGFVAPLVVKVPLTVFVKNWANFKGDPPSLVSSDWPSRCLSADGLGRSQHLAAKLFLALQDWAAFNKDGIAQLHLSVKPTVVYAKESIKKGGLCVPPNVALNCISLKSDPASGTHGYAPDLKCTVAGVTVFIKKPWQPFTPSVDAWKPDAYVDPFWWFSTSEVEHDCFVTVKEMKIAPEVIVPCIVNEQAIPQHAKLMVFREKQPVAALHQCSIVQVTKATATATQSGAAAKAKAGTKAKAKAKTKAKAKAPTKPSPKRARGVDYD